MNRWCRSLPYVLTVLIIIEIPFFLAYFFYVHDNDAHGDDRQQSLPQRPSVVQALPPGRDKPSQRKQTDQTVPQKYGSKFEGLDFEDLLAKIKGTGGQNLRVRITQDKASKRPQVTLGYTPLSFPKNIEASKEKMKKAPRKGNRYVFVHQQYTDQLSKNTRAFLSLCAQAGTSGRRVVRPFVRQTKLSSDSSWPPLETYYDTEYLDSLLEVAGYASLVDREVYVRECPFSSAEHVSIHFIDNSQASMGLTRAHFRINEEYYQSIVKNTTEKGWTRCMFLERKMEIVPNSKQFCVNGDIIKDWKILENDIIGNKKCLNIYLWRGIDGVTYRLKFSEDHLKFSSIDLTFALKPGRPVMKEVKRFRGESLSGNYIAVYIRSEFMLRGRSMEYLRKCVNLVLEVLRALKITTGVSHVYVATDMSDFGSSWLVRYRSQKHLDENVFKDIHDDLVSNAKGMAYHPPSYVTDRGVIALVDMTLMSQAQYLISAGTGTFQQWVTAKFLENHRNDKQSWSKITVCT